MACVRGCVCVFLCVFVCVIVYVYVCVCARARARAQVCVCEFVLITPRHSHHSSPLSSLLATLAPELLSVMANSLSRAAIRDVNLLRSLALAARGVPLAKVKSRENMV